MSARFNRTWNGYEAKSANDVVYGMENWALSEDDLRLITARTLERQGIYYIVALSIYSFYSKVIHE